MHNPLHAAWRAGKIIVNVSLEGNETGVKVGFPSAQACIGEDVIATGEKRPPGLARLSLAEGC
jgi:hypothetical protein